MKKILPKSSDSRVATEESLSMITKEKKRESHSFVFRL